MKKYLLLSDCSATQICGVKRKQEELNQNIKENGDDCLLINSDEFTTFRPPYWKDVKIMLPTVYSYYKLSKMIEDYDPDCICILTEGTIGLCASIHCKLMGRKYSTMRCTRIEEYFNYKISKYVINHFLTCFHSFSHCCISPSVKLSKTYEHKNSVGILNGCNTDSFSIEGNKDKTLENYEKPLWLYVGRLTSEKNVLEICNVSKKLPGTFIIVGDGPMKQKLIGENIKTLGWKQNEELSSIYRSCDMFIFPSKTDTFGQVMVEAMASGLPVSAYDCYGPNEVVKNGITGFIEDDLLVSCNKTYDLFCEKEDIKTKCVEHTKTFSWKKMTQEFINVQTTAEKKYNLYMIFPIPLMLSFLWIITC